MERFFFHLWQLFDLVLLVRRKIEVSCLKRGVVFVFSRLFSLSGSLDRCKVRFLPTCYHRACLLDRLNCSRLLHLSQVVISFRHRYWHLQNGWVNNIQGICGGEEVWGVFYDGKLFLARDVGFREDVSSTRSVLRFQILELGRRP